MNSSNLTNSTETAAPNS
jgi:ammonium transporter, Amt family